MPAPLLEDTVQHALGRRHRDDVALPRTGGPLGNARLTAWTGLLLLVLALAEVVTLISVRRLIAWHIVIGVLLIPPTVLKIGATGWRMVRYYAGSPDYRRAGPPPVLLRLLGPVVVVSTIAVLASGSLLVYLGERRSRTSLVTVLGHRIDWVTVHQVSFAAWAVSTGLHVLGRLVPALRVTRLGATARVAGGASRAVALLLALAVAALAAVLVLGASDSWRHDVFELRDGLGHSG